MELVSPSRAVVSSCSRVIAPSRRACATSRHKEKRGRASCRSDCSVSFCKRRPLLCKQPSLSGGERGCCNGERKDVVDGRISRRAVLALLLASPALSVAFSARGKTKSRNPYDERRLLEQNKKIQEANRAPDDFPNFIREGFDVKVVTSDNYITRDSGLMYEDIKVGTGDCPKDGQQVVFHYVGYNEAGRRIDSTYIQGSPAKIRLGNKTLVPGFEEGIRDMKPGGKRRIIIPPELGPPNSILESPRASDAASTGSELRIMLLWISKRVKNCGTFGRRPPAEDHGSPPTELYFNLPMIRSGIGSSAALWKGGSW